MQALYSAAGLAAGVALFLFGMCQLTRGLQQAAGERMQQVLRCVTGRPLQGLLTGVLVTAALQSSSAAVVLVVGFVSAGVLELPQALPVLFGANVGTTLTAQLLAMDLDWLGRPALAAGFCLAVAARQPSAQGAGRALFGFGMLFEGVHLMEKTLAPMAQAPFFRQMLTQVSQHPVWGLALGLGMTLLAQSSSATVAVLQQAAAQPIPGSTVSLLGRCRCCWEKIWARPSPHGWPVWGGGVQHGRWRQPTRSSIFPGRRSVWRRCPGLWLWYSSFRPLGRNVP